MPTQKSLIFFMENTGEVALLDVVPAALRPAVKHIIDTVANNLENWVTGLQAQGKYDRVISLIGNQCTRANLVTAFTSECNAGRTIDLIILGHGSSDSLLIYNNQTLTGGSGGNIRSIRTAVPAINSHLRMVYMCNCYGSTLNDDWLHVGAKVSIGSQQNDYMPEPMSSYFLHNWLNHQKALDAANNAYNATIPFYLPVYPPTVRIKYKTVQVTVPDPTWAHPFGTKQVSVQVPDGVETTQHNYITQTKLIVGGDQNCQY